jgi:hypothetical protein
MEGRMRESKVLKFETRPVVKSEDIPFCVKLMLLPHSEKLKASRCPYAKEKFDKFVRLVARVSKEYFD